MLHTFTENDRLREKYRLHEEWLRVRRGEEAQRKQLEKALLQERLAREQERAAKEAALKKMDEMEKRSIILMRKTGHSDEEIATLLEIPLEKIKKT